MADNEVLASRLAREIARDLSPVDMVREKFGLSEEDYARLIKSPIFQMRLEEELAIWNASDSMSVAERIRVKAGTMIEESLFEVYEMIHDKNQPMVGKIRALEWASRMAGIGEDRNGAQAGGLAGDASRINFNIFIGGEKQSFSVQPDQPKLVEGEVVLVDK